MIRGRKVKVTSRPKPFNTKIGEVVHVFKDQNNLWLSIIDYEDGERFVAVEGVDDLKYMISKEYLE